MMADLLFVALSIVVVVYLGRVAICAAAAVAGKGGR